MRPPGRERGETQKSGKTALFCLTNGAEPGKMDKEYV